MSHHPITDKKPAEKKTVPAEKLFDLLTSHASVNIRYKCVMDKGKGGETEIRMIARN